ELARLAQPRRREARAARQEPELRAGAAARGGRARLARHAGAGLRRRARPRPDRACAGAGAGRTRGGVRARRARPGCGRPRGPAPASRGGAGARRGLRGKSRSFAPARLREAGELGWLGMLVPASADGLGLGLTELALVLEQAGRGLVCEPIGLAAIAAAALAQGYAPHPILRRAICGDALVVPALQESTHDPLALRTQATGNRAPRLTGTKMSVCADGADGFLVSARGSDGPALYYVPRDGAGVSVATAPTVDGRTLATLELKDASADLVPARQSSRSAVEALTDLALIALSAELLGVMEGAQELTF